MNAAKIGPDKALKRDVLARAFLRSLKRIERKDMLQRDRFRHDILDGDDGVTRRVRAIDSAPRGDRVLIRADLAAVAVLVARAIEAEPGLLRRLRHDAPVVTIATHVGGVGALVRRIVQRCVFGDGRMVVEPSRGSSIGARKGDAALIVWDGADKRDANEIGNDVVAAMLHARVPFIGVAPDPRRELPRDLVRAADAAIALPSLDPSALALVVEAVVGSRPTRVFDHALLSTIEVADLTVALRCAVDPEAALDAIARILSAKNEHVHEGPTLRELQGYGEAREWGLALAHDLKLFRSGAIAWRDLDTRALLTGPPGVGKSSFVGIVARECSLPLVATSVADWHQSEYLSGTLRCIREVFASARSRAPCILFIDELDGISDRAEFRGQYVQYWSQVVNLILELLSAGDELEGVVVVAATNFPDRIDAAIRRAGRLDREIAIGLPGMASLSAIFRQYIANELPSDVSLTPLALAAHGRTGADVEAWVRRARGVARRAGRGILLDDILTEIRAGRPPLPVDVRRRIALHEAGHVIVYLELKLGPEVDLVLHDGGGEAFVTVNLAGDATYDRVEAYLSVLLAGRLAEEIGLGAVSLGGASDLTKATALARDLELRFGNGLTGLVQIEPYDGDLVMVRGLLEAVSERLRAAEAHARILLERSWASVEAVAASLEAAGYLAGPDVLAIVAKAQASPPSSDRSDQDPRTTDPNIADLGPDWEAEPCTGASS
ncbi:cell division protease FtsH [Methylobacterium sp. OAE515]|uniref:AAA family ATPase n=1 Tax=Methylobacterium sp. OAE515 TaxID=2817895 RepID=UPI00178ADF95